MIQIVSYERTKIFDASTRKIEYEFSNIEELESARAENEFLDDALSGETDKEYRVETEQGESAY